MMKGEGGGGVGGPTTTEGATGGVGGSRKREEGTTGAREEAALRDTRIVVAMLRSMGVAEYEPQVVHHFLELWYRYVVDVLTDALVYSEHAGKPAIDTDDVKLAIQSRVNFSFSQPPPREVILELARSRNKIPLPKSIAGLGMIPLPPEQDTLISPNYQLLIPKKQAVAAVQATEGPEEEEEDEEEDAPPPYNPNLASVISSTTSLSSNPPQEEQQQQRAGDLAQPLAQQQQQQETPQRVSFPLSAGKHPLGAQNRG